MPVITLRFPAEQPVPELLPLDALPPAPAPTLVPVPPPELPPAPAAPLAPPPPPPRRQHGTKLAVLAGVVACVVMVTVTVTMVATSPDDTPTASEALTAPVPADENSARELLENQVANDRARAESLVGYWVPQVSSKRFGLVVNGITYDYRAIWSDFTTMQSRHPGALLLWSTDYSSFRLPDHWVTIAPDSFGSGEAANEWCVGQGIGVGDCYAKRLSYTGGFAENTLLRR